MPGVINRVTGGWLPPSHCLASYDTSLAVSGGVDCGRRRRNVYDKKPRRYAKDNRTAHLTAHSDKSVAYVTNNKRLYLTFCTVEANHWQTRSIVRPLCDSRATCWPWKLSGQGLENGKNAKLFFGHNSTTSGPKNVTFLWPGMPAVPRTVDFLVLLYNKFNVRIYNCCE